MARVEVEGAAAYALAADVTGLAKAGGRARGAGGGSRTVRLLPGLYRRAVGGGAFTASTRG